MDEVITASDASSSFGSAESQPSIIPSNLPLLSAFLSFALAQFLKLFTTWFKEKRWDSRRMLGSGGMPSSHSATVTALAVAIGLHEGTGGPAFALAVVLACVVMYDASGVRLHAGRQAEAVGMIFSEISKSIGGEDTIPGIIVIGCDAALALKFMWTSRCNSLCLKSPEFKLYTNFWLLNQIVCELPPEHPVSNVRPLRDSLGHTPLQVVAGAVLGCLVAILMKNSN